MTDQEVFKIITVSLLFELEAQVNALLNIVALDIIPYGAHFDPLPLSCNDLCTESKDIRLLNRQ